MGKAQYSYIKEKGVKGVSFLCTCTAETVSLSNILEKAISERKEKIKTVEGSPDCKSENTGDLLTKAFRSPNFVSMNL